MLISCPGDISPEDLSEVKNAIERWNVLLGERLNRVIIPVHWKAHAAAEFGDSAQAILNRQIVDNVDMALAIFWQRLGTPTDSAESGTADEIVRLHDAGKPVSILCCDRAVSARGDHNERSRLDAYLESIGRHALVMHYENLAELAKQVDTILTRLVTSSEERRGDHNSGPAERAAASGLGHILNSLLRHGLRQGRLPLLSELTDNSLGPTPTTHSVRGTTPYVGRTTIDSKLRSALSQNDGETVTFLVLVGPSKSGKSRTALEAARAVLPNAPMLVPRSGSALSEIVQLDPPQLAAAAPFLIWLDDLTVADTDYLTWDVFDRLQGRASVLGTMRDMRWDEIYYSGSEIAAASRSALYRAEKFELRFGLTAAELAQAREHYPDHRSTLNVGGDSVSIAEVLVGGEQLWSKYCAGRDQCPEGHALVQAAIDWQRAGVVRACPEPDLFGLYGLYLSRIRINLEPTRESFIEGLRWASEPVASQVALLRPTIDQSTERSWSAFSYLVAAEDGQGDRPPRPIPDDLWAMVLARTPPWEALAIGMSAHLRGFAEAEEAAFLKLAESDDPNASAGALNVGTLRAARGDVDGAVTAFRMAIDSGHPYDAPAAAVSLGDMLATNHDSDGAAKAYNIAIESSNEEEASRAVERLQILQRPANRVGNCGDDR